MSDQRDDQAPGGPPDIKPDPIHPDDPPTNGVVEARDDPPDEHPIAGSAGDAATKPLDPDAIRATPESLASRIDGASGPDRIAIAMLVGIVVLLLICVLFALAAR